MVYFVQHIGSGEIKIGWTRHVPGRMQWLLREVGPIELLAVIPGMRPEERELHDYFDQYRLHGEWFYPSEWLLEFIYEIESCEPVGVVPLELGLDSYVWTPTPEEPDTTPLPAWLAGTGSAADRGLPLRPPSRRAADNDVAIVDD